jgi:hypothetical protein
VELAELAREVQAVERAGGLTVELSDGSVGYLVRAPRRDDCFAAALATVLQVPIDEVPDSRLHERARAGEDREEIRRSAARALADWLSGRGLRAIIHRRVPAARARWIGVGTHARLGVPLHGDEPGPRSPRPDQGSAVCRAGQDPARVAAGGAWSDSSPHVGPGGRRVRPQLSEPDETPREGSDEMAFAIGAGSVGVAAVTGKLGHTEFVIDAADLARLREVRAAAAVRIAEMRHELEDAEAELAVLDEALAEVAPDPPVLDEGLEDNARADQ